MFRIYLAPNVALSLNILPRIKLRPIFFELTEKSYMDRTYKQSILMDLVYITFAANLELEE